MKVILPFKYPCIIDSLSGVANNVAIYMNYEEYYTPLLIANHFLISYSEELGHGGYNWEYYNDDYGHFIDVRDEAEQNGLVPTIKKYIKNKKYIKIIMDFYYIKKTPWYKEKHLLHWIPTIFGYDDKKEIFYVCDNLHNGKLKIFEVGYEELIQARLGHEREILQYCYYDEEIDYNLTLDYLKVLVRSYLDSKCYIEKKFYTFDKNNGELKKKELYGMDVYNILIQQTEECDIHADSYDIKTFHIMVDHVKICNELMRWIRNTGYIIADKITVLDKIELRYKELLDQTIISQNLYIKLSITFSERDKIELQNMIRCNREKERDLLTELIQILR